MKSILFILIFLVFSCTKAQRSPSSTESVLYIGDSQSEGYLGGIVYQHLKNESKIQKIDLYGVGSSSPRHWGDERTSKNSLWLCKRKSRYNDKHGVLLKNTACKAETNQSAFGYLNRSKPDLVVFQFLGNSMGFNDDYIIKKIGNLLGELDTKQECLFVTSPPYYKDLVERNKLRVKTQAAFVKGVAGRCEMVLGVNEETLSVFAADRGNFLSDRIHLSQKGAKIFFQMMEKYLP